MQSDYGSLIVSLTSTRRRNHTLIDLEIFNEKVLNLMFSYKNHHLLPFERHYPMQRPGRVAFAKILEERLVDKSSVGSPLHQTINDCIDLLQTVSSNSQDDLDQRRRYRSILCSRTINVLSMRQAIQSLSILDETPPEHPALGALILAAAIGSETAVTALLAQGTPFEGESSFFGSALHAAAEYGQMSVVWMGFSTPMFSYDAFLGAIRGGKKDIMGKLMGQYDPNILLSVYETEQERLIEHAASEDQAEILDMLLKYYFTCDSHEGMRRLFTKGALYHAVLSSARSTMRQLVNIGVDISTYEISLGNGLYIASKRGDLETVQLLVEHGFSNGHGPNSFDNCMHVAAAKGYINVVDFFLCHGVDVNCRFPCPTGPSGMDEDFWDMINGNDPATTNAARNSDFRMFCFLVLKGCRVDHENEFRDVQKQWLERLHAWKEVQVI